MKLTIQFVLVLALTGSLSFLPSCKSQSPDRKATASKPAGGTPPAQANASSADDVLKIAGDTEFGDLGGCPETIEVARKAGYDYKKVIAGCLRKDADSFHQLFVMTKKAGFDAASSEGHAAVLGELLRQMGDSIFGRCLIEEAKDVQEAVHEKLLYDMGDSNVPMSDIRRLKAGYPLTFQGTTTATDVSRTTPEGKNITLNGETLHHTIHDR